MGKVKVAVVGLGFGAEFIPLYQKHPDAECYIICQRNEENLNKVGDQFGVERRTTRFEDLLEMVPRNPLSGILKKDLDSPAIQIRAHGQLSHTIYGFHFVMCVGDDV